MSCRIFTYNLLATSKFVHVLAIFRDDQNGGTSFVPAATASFDESNSFLHDAWANLSPNQLGCVDELYTPQKVPLVGGGSDGAYFGQVSKAYDDLHYRSAGLYASTAYANASIPSWPCFHNFSAATHTSELGAIWGSSSGAGTQIRPIIEACWTGFIKNFDLNKERFPETSTWNEWHSDNQQRRVFSDDAAANTVADSLQKDQGDFLESIAPPWDTG